MLYSVWIIMNLFGKFLSIVIIISDLNGIDGFFLFTILLNSLIYSHKPIHTQVEFYCAQTHNPETFQQVYLNDTSLSEKLNTSQPIAFFIHGYLESYRHSMYVKITEEYLKYIESNFCVVDWRNLAYMTYNLSVQQTERVGNYTADFIRYLIETEHFTIDDIRLFGFSLGAHVAGFTGASLKGEVPLIIGLDPAGPRFTKPPEFNVGNHLNPTNAKFVQVIHTDRMIFGVQNAIGHADYYPNDAINPQPGCNLSAFPEMITCSHTRSRDIFLASLNPENKFISYECDSFQKYSQGLCSSHSSDVLGVYSKNSVLGKMYLETTASFPYVP